ncbi:MAG: NAD(P)-dependent oxidoreductase [Nanoarchaeota archaeon]
MPESVLITGGAGYLGSVLTDRFLSRGHKVTVVDSLVWNQNSPLFFLAREGYSFIHGDARDKNLLKKLVDSHDVLIPLAALVGAPLCENSPREAEEINTGAIALIDGLRSPGQKLVFPNTNSGYGTKSGDSFCTEETPLEPISCYGRTKVEAERILLGSRKPTLTLRLATVFGPSPRMRTDLLVNDLVYRALSEKKLVIFEGHFKRNFIHIRDVADAFLYAISNFDNMRLGGKNQAYNAGLDEANISKAELAYKIREHIPGLFVEQDEFAQDPDKRNYMVSNEKLSKVGFSARFTLDQGIRELIDYYNVLLHLNIKEPVRLKNV